MRRNAGRLGFNPYEYTHEVRWVLFLDGERAKICRESETFPHLFLMKELRASDEREKASPVRLGQSLSNHVSETERDERDETELKRFLKTVNDELERAWRNSQFSQLTVIAGPKLRGHLKKVLSRHVAQTITHSYNRDVAHLCLTRLASDYVAVKKAEQKALEYSDLNSELHSAVVS